ncbi:uncharacterized protein LOC135091145 isoform X1 [Scylla paramamosain]|uniref:uncharacterized protein LOC135091145 isoform X1 n=1 Tax=Scylla paramamosain TaxID=85552 RepID=UPI003083E690
MIALRYLRYPATQINLIWPQAHCTHTCGDVTDFVASADSLRWQGGICQQQSGVSCNSESICKQSQVPRVALLEELLNISLFPDSQCFWVHWLLLCCQVITGIKCSISMAHQTLPLTLVVLTCLVNTCPPVFLPLIALQVTSECG